MLYFAEQIHITLFIPNTTTHNRPRYRTKAKQMRCSEKFVLLSRTFLGILGNCFSFPIYIYRNCHIKLYKVMPYSMGNYKSTVLSVVLNYLIFIIKLCMDPVPAWNHQQNHIFVQKHHIVQGFIRIVFNNHIKLFAYLACV